MIYLFLSIAALTSNTFHQADQFVHKSLLSFEESSSALPFWWAFLHGLRIHDIRSLREAQLYFPLTTKNLPMTAMYIFLTLVSSLMDVSSSSHSVHKYLFRKIVLLKNFKCFFVKKRTRKNNLTVLSSSRLCESRKLQGPCLAPNLV